VSTHDPDGAGSTAATALAGTISHSQYAACAPAPRLSGARRRPTTSMEMLDATVSTTSEKSA
jgi:hypothetical protein